MTALHCDIELRQDPERRGPGRLYGVLMRYGTPGENGGERFDAGALRWPDDGVVLRRQHDPRGPIARVVPETRGGDVVIDAVLPDSTAGRDAAVEVRSGLLRGLSVEFRALRQRYDRGVRVITDALLTGAGLVDAPSYPASTAEVRRRRPRNLYL